jgi:hypothetical protein
MKPCNANGKVEEYIKLDNPCDFLSITSLQICTNEVPTRLIVECDQTFVMRSQSLFFNEMSTFLIDIDPEILSKTLHVHYTRRLTYNLLTATV